MPPKKRSTSSKSQNKNKKRSSSKSSSDLQGEAPETRSDSESDHPTQHRTVMDYFYKKVDLLETASYNVEDDTMRDEIWSGLPPEFRVHLSWSQVRRLAIPQLGRVLNEKDFVYRELCVQCIKKEERRDWRKKERESRPELSRGYDRESRSTAEFKPRSSNIKPSSSPIDKRRTKLWKRILQTLRTYRAINDERIRKVALWLANASSVINGITMSIARSDPLHTMQSIPSINGLPKKILPRLIVPKNLLVALPILPTTSLLILLEQINS